jgi:ligand-binding sensor domain-containing protein
VRVLLVLVIVLFELAGSRAAAAGQYRFDVWTTEHGLPANRIQALRQTRDGYLWATTSEGLARLDGVRFQVFTRQNTPILTSD